MCRFATDFKEIFPICSHAVNRAVYLDSASHLCDWSRMNRPKSNRVSDPPGLAARRIAAEILENVLRRGRPLDEQLEGHRGLAALEDRDRALTRRLIATVLRRLGTLRHLLTQFLDRGPPAKAPQVEAALLIGAAQILWLDVPDHAAVDLSVRLAQADDKAKHFAGLINAVLRRVTREGPQRLAQLDSADFDTPSWLMQRWVRAYGADTAREIARANAHEPALDLTVKSNAEDWAAKLQGAVLPTGTVRTVAHGRISSLPGFSEGAWWVQDAAAALPVRLFGNLRGKRAADLCAAPGGKTMQLAHAGAQVTAVDRSESRLNRVRDNLTRLALQAEIVAADATEWNAEPFDAVLLDAPCSSTGTIRRHPDVPWIRHESDITALTSLQQRLLERAAALVKPGGTMVYCVCSLEPEEGIDQVTAFLEREPALRRRPIVASEIGGLSELLTPAGDLRSLPFHLPAADSRLSGVDGFYASRLERLS
jgi:16S rRNA (cytosine967-C5)-methyltransferase